jgi:hypothetical protein
MMLTRDCHEVSLIILMISCLPIATKYHKRKKGRCNQRPFKIWKIFHLNPERNYNVRSAWPLQS